MAQSSVLIRSRIKKAQQLLEQNKLDEARLLYQHLCSSKQNDIDLWLTLAVLNRKLGHFKEAEANCHRALSLQQNSAQAHHIAGSIQQCLGALDTAIASYRTAIRLDPTCAESYYFLANALQMLGQSEEAVQNYRTAIDLRPDYLEALSNLGAVLIGLHRFNEARAVLEKADRHYPDRPQILCNLGDLCMLQERFEQALEYARSALRNNSRFFDAHYLLGRIHRQQKDYPRASESFADALLIQPANENVIGSLAELYEIRGKFDEALALVNPLIERGTDNALVLKAFSALSRHYKTEQIAAPLLEKAIADGRLDISQQIRLHSELGKQYDHLKDYRRAFGHYREANQLERKLNKHLMAMAGDIFTKSEAIKEWFVQFGRDYWTRLPRSGVTGSNRPIFVVGMPRSGTTLVEQILSSHRSVHGAGELAEIQDIADQLSHRGTSLNQPLDLANVGQQQLAAAAAQYLEVLNGQSPEALRVVDKMPMNFWHLGLISLLFPNAYVIHMQRDPRDVCLSMYFQRFSNSMSFTTDLRELAEYYLAYSTIMEYWKTVLDIRILNIQYEQLIDDQEQMIHKIIDYCGLDWDERCLQFYMTDRDVHTPSYDQVRQPMYRKSVGRWKHYEPELAQFTTALGLGH